MSTRGALRVRDERGARKGIAPLGAPPQPYAYYPLAPNPIGGMAPPHTPYSQSAPFFTIVREHESLPPPVGPIGSQFPYGMPSFAGGVPPTLQSQP